MKIFQFIKFIDLVTMLNAVAGVMSIFYSLKGELYTAVVYLFIAVVLDALDGKISRLFEKSSGFGKELDSLADIVSFGITPIIFVNAFVEQSAFMIVAYSIFLIAGMLRLARFNLSSKPYFEGLPITLNGIIIPVLFLIDLPLIFYPYVFIILGLFMISDFRIKKLLR